MDNPVRVRFAPSPTGFLHIGGLRSALYNQLFARHSGGTFILRIEDTDRTRLVEGAVESLLRTLAAVDMVPDEGPVLDSTGKVIERGNKGPYVQSARTELYKTHAEKLVADHNAYRCFCTLERLEEVRKGQAAAKLPVMYDRLCRVRKPDESAALFASGAPFVIRLKMPVDGKTSFDDAVRGKVEFENALIDDQVLMKTDGFPTYHLANVVDDHLMDISQVIRGEEWLPSTPKHLALYDMFGWKAPTFAHLPLLLNADRSKLSKRQGDVAVEDYLKKGYVPDALINFVLLLGWSPEGDKEIFTRKEMAESFTLERVNKAGAVFNVDKLDWFNKEHLKLMSAADIAKLAAPFYAAAGLPTDFAMLEKAVALEQRRVTTLAELPEATRYLFEEIILDPSMLPWKKAAPDMALRITQDRLAWLYDFLSALPEDDWEAPMGKDLEESIFAFIKEKGWSNGETLWPLRVALTGREKSAGPFEVAWALGRGHTLKRIKAASIMIA